MIKSLLPFLSILAVAASLPVTLKAQQDSSYAMPKVHIKSYIQDGDNKKEIVIERNFNSPEEMSDVLDSLLGNLKLGSDDLKQLRIMGESMELMFKDRFFGGLDSLMENIGGLFEGENPWQSLDPNNSRMQFDWDDARPFLGIVSETVLNEENPDDKDGILITRVVPGSSAALAGIQPNDYIISVDNIDIESILSIRDILLDKSIGDKINIVYERDGKMLETVAVLLPKAGNQKNWADAQAHIPGMPKCDKIILQKSGPRLGIGVIDLDKNLRKETKVRKGGAFITQVDKNCCGRKMGLQNNDVIRKVNDEKITSAEQLKEVISTLPVGEPITIDITRAGKKKTIDGTINEYSKAWEENMPINIIDFTAREHHLLEQRILELENRIEELSKKRRRN